MDDRRGAISLMGKETEAGKRMEVVFMNRPLHRASEDIPVGLGSLFRCIDMVN